MGRKLYSEWEGWRPFFVEEAGKLGLPDSVFEDVGPLAPRVRIRTVREWWIEVPHDEWVAAYRIMLKDGAPVVAELRVFPNETVDGRPYGRWSAEVLGDEAAERVPGNGVSRKLLREIHPIRHLDDLKRAIDRAASFDVDRVNAEAEGRAEFEEAARHLFPEAGLPAPSVPMTRTERLKSRGLSPRAFQKPISGPVRLAMLAKHYERACEHTGHPFLILRRVEPWKNLADQTLRDLVTKARKPEEAKPEEAGYLSPLKENGGVAGGRATEKADAELARAGIDPFGSPYREQFDQAIKRLKEGRRR